MCGSRRATATEVVPGITAMSGCWSLAGAPIAQGDDVFVVLPATLPEAELERRLADADAAVVMKLGRHLEKVRRVLDRTGRLSRAIYVERGTTAERSPCRSQQKRDDVAPYFSVILVPGWESAGSMSGSLAVVGLGPGSPQTLTPEAARGAATPPTRSTATAPISTACRRAPGQTRHASDNREEGARAAAALRHAAEGAQVALVSGGDPGVFAMAAAVCEQIERGDAAWRKLDVSVVPGVTAMLAVAARVGAPLGHDFCAISLSDNLKPWELVERRLDAAAGAGFVIALYNPISRARPWQLGKAFERLRRHLPAATPVVFGRADRPRRTRSVSVVAAGRRRSVARRHGDAHHRRLGADARDRAAGPGAAGLHAAVGGRSRRMIEPGHGILHGVDRRHVGQGGPAQHDDVDAERARRRDLAVGRVAAAVLGDDDFDAVLAAAARARRLR